VGEYNIENNSTTEITHKHIITKSRKYDVTTAITFTSDTTFGFDFSYNKTLDFGVNKDEYSVSISVKQRFIHTDKKTTTNEEIDLKEDNINYTLKQKEKLNIIVKDILMKINIPAVFYFKNIDETETKVNVMTDNVNVTVNERDSDYVEADTRAESM